MALFALRLRRRLPGSGLLSPICTVLSKRGGKFHHWKIKNTMLRATEVKSNITSTYQEYNNSSIVQIFGEGRKHNDNNKIVH